MKRFLIWGTALGVLVGGLPGYSAEPPKEPQKAQDTAEKEAPKKVKKARRHGKKVKQPKSMAVVDKAGSPFADVPKDHWAYEAVGKAVESGLLQGFENKFYGGRAMTRYQMAVVVARMLEKLAVLRQNGRMFTAQDIANLEALTIEFADELALLNVKVSTLEEQTAVLRKDVDQLKYEVGTGGPRSPITGIISTRTVLTSSASPGYGQGWNQFPASAATPSLLRYRGDVAGPGVNNGAAPGSATNRWQYDNRFFASVSQLSLNIDRQVMKDVEFHAQIDVNAEAQDDSPWAPIRVAALGRGITLGPEMIFDWNAVGANPAYRPFNGVAGNMNLGPYKVGTGRGSSFATGSPIHVNEAYAQFNGWIGDSDGKLGVYATPFNVENNGPSRTYNWTLTPSIANTFWEGLRATGLEFRNSRKEDYWLWNLGLFSNLDVPNFGAGGTLLSGYQTGLLAGVANTVCDPFGNSSASAVGRMPTPRMSVMTDAPRGVDGQGELEGVGWYARVGGQNKDNKGFGWQLGYMDNGGNIRPSQGSFGASEWQAWQVEADYKWDHWLLLTQYYGGRTANYSTLELDGIGVVDTRLANVGSPFPNLGRLSTDTDSWMALVSYAWSKNSSFTVRFEDAKDQTGRALIGADAWTFAYNRKLGERGMLQAEYITIDSRTVSDNGTRNDIDINDDLAQVNYRLQF